MKNKENFIKEQLLNINLPSSNLQERVFAEIRKQNGEKKNIDNKNNEQTKEENVAKDYKNSIKTSEKTPWYTYLSVAAVICVIAGTTFAFSKMDRSNNRGGDETTVTTLTTVTSETSETTSVVTSVTEDKVIVTSAVENTSQVETTSVVETKNSEISKTEETQTSNQQKIYEDGEKYSWFKQPVYDFDDVEPILDFSEYLNYNIKYCDAFKVKKGDKCGLIDSEGDIKTEIIYEKIYGGIYKGESCYWAYKNKYEDEYQEESEKIRIDKNDYKVSEETYSNWMWRFEYWDFNRSKAVVEENGEGAYVNIKDINDNYVHVVEFAEYIPESTDFENGGVPWDRYKGIGQFALCKDNKLITNEVYSSATDLADNCVAFEKDGKWGYLNEKGEQILPFEFDTAYGDLVKFSTKIDKEYPFICTEGIIAAFKDGQCGYYDNKGNVIVEMGVFEDITPAKDGKAFVKKDGKWGIIKINS